MKNLLIALFALASLEAMADPGLDCKILNGKGKRYEAALVPENGKRTVLSRSEFARAIAIYNEDSILLQVEDLVTGTNLGQIRVDADNQTTTLWTTHPAQGLIWISCKKICD